MDENIPTQTQEINQTTPKGKFSITSIFTRKKIIIGLILIILILIGIIAVNLLTNQDPVIAEVEGENINQSDLEYRISEAFAPSDFDRVNSDQDIKNNLVNELVKEKIIEIEAKKRGISVSDEEVEAVMTPDEKGNPAAYRIHRNSIMRERVAEAVVASRVINALTSYKEPDLPNFIELSEQTTTSMDLVRSDMLQNGLSMNEAFNAHLSQSGFDSRITYRPNIHAFPSTLSESIYSQLLPLKVGEISEVLYDNAGTYLMAQILEANDSEFLSFDEWLNFKISETQQ